MLVSGARNFATGVEKPAPETDASFQMSVSGACVIGIKIGLRQAVDHVSFYHHQPSVLRCTPKQRRRYT